MRKIAMFVVLGTLLCSNCSTGKEPEVVRVPGPSYVHLTDGSYVSVSSREEFLAIPEELRGDAGYIQRYDMVYK